MRKNMDNDFITDFIFLYKLIYLLYYKFIIYMLKNCKNKEKSWGLGIGDWGLGIGPNPQSPIPNPPIPNPLCY